MKRLAWVAMVIAAMAMMACGGSSSSGPSYSGNSSPAVIDDGMDGNYEELLELVIMTVTPMVTGDLSGLFGDMPMFRAVEAPSGSETYVGDCGGTFTETYAYASDEMYSMVTLVFPFWSLVTSYIGVRSLFDVIKWRALLWFLILPGILYFLAFGLLALLFAFAGN